ncbi:MAG: beta-ketoacyl-ACP synthase II [Melioribacteraceae bacterium]|nr:beta-ketoacyl-ACP synthase II [Melioribacteraceae bacterium]MCF8352832.1 beta-ketoacyl-ACP synthase II [Melioribacteraceae bacterium]MCF8393448.1 beta-ketoacyl-ACP synthase II [Melioribacteraceae bacterium]MCF8417349.1 beta-ketoacyl-ACP synthase II [Melioribacteraceae bacterium]
MDKRRVVITGMGTVNPIGNSVKEYWEGLKNGRNGAGPITKFDASDFATQFACEVKNFDPSMYLDKKAIRRMDPYTVLAMAAATQAVQDSQINFDDVDTERAGVIFGSGIGGMDTFETQHRIFIEQGPRRISPFFVPMMISDIAAGQISMQWGLKGPNYATTSACATSSHAIADAFIHIQRGSADIILCGGAEAAITPMAVGGFNAARAISTWNDKYLQASRPFDKDRNGFVMAEGAGVIVLEDYESAIKRGAVIHAEIIGVGLTGDAFHLTAPAPEGDGARRSMRDALRDGGINPEQIDYINAHGTSTELNDLNETKAIKNLFKEHAYKLAVSSTKSMTGHLLGAAGVIESIATILAINNSLIPPTINLDTPDPECDLDYTPKVAKELNVDFALSNTFGFGGHNASLLFKKFSG